MAERMKQERARFRPVRQEPYRIVEIEPANGYERSEAPWQFLVSYDGTIAGETTLYNEKIDKRVGIGRIYAHYESTNGSSGSYGLGVPDWLKQPKAGDTTDSFKWYVLATIFAMGAGGLVLIGRRKGKKKMMRRRYFSALMFTGGTGICQSRRENHGESGIRKPNAEYCRECEW